MNIMGSQWFKKLLGNHPAEAFKFTSQLEGLPPDLFTKVDEIFSMVNKIEFNKIGTKENPGWMMILDQKLSVWFFQKGDNWIYDGFEIGDYTGK